MTIGKPICEQPTVHIEVHIEGIDLASAEFAQRTVGFLASKFILLLKKCVSWDVVSVAKSALFSRCPKTHPMAMDRPQSSAPCPVGHVEHRHTLRGWMQEDLHNDLRDCEACALRIELGYLCTDVSQFLDVLRAASPHHEENV